MRPTIATTHHIEVDWLGLRLILPGRYTKDLVVLPVELGEHTIGCGAVSHDLVKTQPIDVAEFPMDGGPLAGPGDHGQEPRLYFGVLGLGLNLLREVL